MYSRLNTCRCVDVLAPCSTYAVHDADPGGVYAHVFGEGLRDEELHLFFGENTDRKRVLLQVASAETLVGDVEQGDEFALDHEVPHLAPLVGREVEPGGVVAAGLEYDDGSPVVGPQGRHHRLEVDALFHRFEVGVLAVLEPRRGD
ncbi:uncharacterized protein BcabD6B2_28850 [Babesia caballi]|uniref:Uncharacterized protein n=1 Tax=Babesia caballi TaxID=5871 RepID=A0AAV4LV31_BABCB|nr:hypothetical protein BcabD6B2_28850 [Babesia caballi]